MCWIDDFGRSLIGWCDICVRNRGFVGVGKMRWVLACIVGIVRKWESERNVGFLMDWKRGGARRYGFRWWNYVC